MQDYGGVDGLWGVALRLVGTGIKIPQSVRHGQMSISIPRFDTLADVACESLGRPADVHEEVVKIKSC